MEDPRIDPVLRELQAQGEAERKKERSLRNARLATAFTFLVAAACLFAIYKLSSVSASGGQSAQGKRTPGTVVRPQPARTQPPAPGSPEEKEIDRKKREYYRLIILWAVLVVDFLALLFSIRWMARLMIGAPVARRRDISL